MTQESGSGDDNQDEKSHQVAAIASSESKTDYQYQDQTVGEILATAPEIEEKPEPSNLFASISRIVT